MNSFKYNLYVFGFLTLSFLSSACESNFLIFQEWVLKSQSADNLTTYVYYNPSVPTTLVSAGIAATGSGNAATGTGVSNTGSPANVSLLAREDFTVGRDVTVSIDASDSIQVCENSPVPVTCDKDSVAFNTADLGLLSREFHVLINGLYDLFIPTTVYEISQVSNINVAGNDNPTQMMVFNDELYFSALNLSGRTKLFKVNSAGIVSAVSNINAADDTPKALRIFNDALYFNAKNAAGFTKLFKLDTGGAITQISDLRTGANDDPDNLTLFNDSLYFSALSSGGYTKIFKVDTSGNIVQVSNIRADNDAPSSLTVFNGKLYFRGSSTPAFSPNKIFSVNTSGVITQVSDLIPGAHDGMYGGMVFGDSLYFAARSTLPSTVVSTGLFKMDKNEVITRLSNLNAVTDLPGSMTAFNGELYFSAKNANQKNKMHKINSQGDITELSDILPGAEDNPGPYTVFAGELYFRAGSTSTLTKLYKATASGELIQISNINPGAGDSISDLTVFGDALYFSATNSTGFKKLYKLKKKF